MLKICAKIGNDFNEERQQRKKENIWSKIIFLLKRETGSKNSQKEIKGIYLRFFKKFVMLWLGVKIGKCWELGAVDVLDCKN